MIYKEFIRLGNVRQFVGNKKTQAKYLLDKIHRRESEILHKPIKTNKRSSWPYY